MTDLITYETKMVDTKSHLYNPYPYFMTEGSNEKLIPDVWPRGFPLSKIHDSESFENTIVKPHRDFDRIKVFQSLADHDPDVDAVFRMTGNF